MFSLTLKGVTKIFDRFSRGHENMNLKFYPSSIPSRNYFMTSPLFDFAE